MVKNYWKKQIFFGFIFVFCEMMIFLALLTSRHYLGLIMWALHPWPIFFIIHNLRRKIQGDLSQVSDLFDKGLENLVDNVKNMVPEGPGFMKEDGTKGPGSN